MSNDEIENDVIKNDEIENDVTYETDIIMCISFCIRR